MGNEGICEAEQRMRRVRNGDWKKECKRGRKKRRGKDTQKKEHYNRGMSFYNRHVL